MGTVTSSHHLVSCCSIRSERERRRSEPSLRSVSDGVVASSWARPIGLAFQLRNHTDQGNVLGEGQGICHVVLKFLRTTSHPETSKIPPCRNWGRSGGYVQYRQGGIHAIIHQRICESVLHVVMQKVGCEPFHAPNPRFKRTSPGYPVREASPIGHRSTSWR
jgi:hypothetical protein